MRLRFWYKKRKGLKFHVVPKHSIKDKKNAELAEDLLKWWFDEFHYRKYDE